MKVTWLVERHHDFPEHERLLPFLQNHILLPSGFEEPEDVPEGPLVAFGTIRRLARLARSERLGISVFDRLGALTCQAYYPHVYEMLGRDVCMVPMRALTSIPWHDWMGEEVFARPNGNHKPWEARVFQVKELEELVRAHPHQSDAWVLVSRVTELGSEWRCFCRDGVVFTSSSYPHPPWGPVPQAGRTFASAVARRVLETLGENMLTVDVARDREGRWRLVEIGGVNSWGLYGANIQAFVTQMETEANSRYLASDPDAT